MPPSKLLFLLLLSLPLITCQTEEEEIENFKTHVIRLEALGRSTRLGALYDATTETFSEISVLAQQPPSHLIVKTETPTTNTRFGVMKSYSDKKSLLDVSASITFSFLAGIIDVGGSGRYMRDEQKKSNSVVGSLIYNSLTCEEYLEIFYEEMSPYLSAGTLKNASETHVVIGIGYGSNVIVKFEDINEENRDVTKVQAAMSASLDVLVFGVSAEVSVGVGETNVAQFSNFSLQIYGDLNFGANDYPTNVTHVVSFIQKIPQLIKNNYEGRGAQLFYYLMPLDKVREFLKFESTPQLPPPEEIPPDVIEEQIQVFEEIAIVQLKLNDLVNLGMTNRDILNNVDLASIQNLRNSFGNSSTKYRNEIKEEVIRLRSRRAQKKEVKIGLQAIEKGFREGEDSLEQTEMSLDYDFRDIRLKVEFVEFLRTQGTFWIGRGDTVGSAAMKIFKENGNMDLTMCSVHFHRIYLRNTILFINEIMRVKGQGIIPMIVDCDYPHSTCDYSGGQSRVCEIFHTPV